MMQPGRLIDLDGPLADSLIYATAMRHEATLWTQDEHFKNLPMVRYFAKPQTTL